LTQIFFSLFFYIDFFSIFSFNNVLFWELGFTVLFNLLSMVLSCSHDPDYKFIKFTKLTRIIYFFCHFLDLLFINFPFNIVLVWELKFVVFFFSLLSISLSRSHNSGNGFSRFTRVDSSHSFLVCFCKLNIYFLNSILIY
jgi:hypothetical protein